MQLEQINTLELPSEGKHKYIVATIWEEENSKNVVRCGDRSGYHHDITNILEYDLNGDLVGEFGPKEPTFIVSVRGGGIIEISDKEIILSGYSGSYGRTDPEIIRPLFETHMPDYKVLGYGYYYEFPLPTE